VQLPPKGVLVNTPIGKCELFIRFPRVNAARQEGAHAHQVLFTPRRPTSHAREGEEAYTVCVPDLGSDVVWALEYEPTASDVLRPSAATAFHGGVLDGGGPRHMALHPDPRVHVAYVAYELTSQVASYAVDPVTGQLTGGPLPPGPVCVLDDTGSIAKTELSAAFGAEGAATRARCGKLVQRPSGGAACCSDADTSVAAIRVSPTGSHVFVSSRVVNGDGAISAISLDEKGRLIPPSACAPVCVASSCGLIPRDFCLTTQVGEGGARSLVALVANQDSGTIFAVPVAGGRKARKVAEIPTPVCLSLAPDKERPCARSRSSPLMVTAAAVASGALITIFVVRAFRAWKQ